MLALDIDERLARDFLEAKHHGTESLKVFINTALGECWREDSVEISEHDLFSRIEKYESEIPSEDIVALTASIDCQQDRLECLVAGHGHLDEMWLLRHEIFYGSLMGDQIWEELGAFLQRCWEHPSGKDIRIVRLLWIGIRSGRVYDSARRCRRLACGPVRVCGAIALWLPTRRIIQTLQRVSA